MAETRIDWAALRHEDGGVPWEAIEGAISALVAEPVYWGELASAYREARVAVEEEITHGYLGLYVPVILGEVGAKLPAGEGGTAREWIAEFLLDELAVAEDDGDEFALQALPYACGRMGPSILPQVLRRITDTASDRESDFELWGLLSLAGKCTDETLRNEVARLCIAEVESALRDGGKVGFLLAPLFALASMRCAEARDVLERLGKHKRRELEVTCLWPVYQESLAWVRGEQTGAPPPELWDRAPREFLEKEQEYLREWYENQDAAEDGAGENDRMGPEGGAEADPESLAIRRAQEWAARFAASAHAAVLTQDVRGEAGDRAAMMLRYGMMYCGEDVGKWGKGEWRRILTEILPRKVTAEGDWFADLAPVAGALLRWLETEGLSPGGAAIAEEVENWGPAIERAASDPQNWGMGKTFMMQAQREGVELGNQEQMDAWILKYNAQLARSVPKSVGPGKERMAEASWAEPPPYVREQPKVGRNDPCPCGSGKKYKKCCGR